MQYFSKQTNDLIKNTATILSREEESRLLTLAKAGDIKARNALLNGSLKLIAKMALSYCNAENSAEDLLGEGCLAIDNAIEKYAVGATTRFTSYFMFWVRDAITGTVYDNKVVRYPRNIIKNGESATMIELDKPRLGAESGMSTLSETIADPNDTFSVLVESESLANLAICVSKLKPRERAVIKLMFSDVKNTVNDISGELNISVDTVRSIRNSALRNLRKSLTKLDTINEGIYNVKRI